MRYLKTILVVGSILVLAAGVSAKVEEAAVVETKGVAALSEDVGKDRENALSDAQRLAIEQVVGTFVDSQTLVENFVTISDEIYTKATGFIDNYEILDEGKNDADGTYVVKIKATVSQRPVVDRLKALGVLRQWRIMVVIPEEHTGYAEKFPAAESEVARQLKDAGYYVVDQKQIDKIRESEAVEKVAEGDIEGAVAMGQRFGAEIVVAGEAVGELGGTAGGGGYGGMSYSFKSVRARGDVRAIRVDTGEIVATARAEGSGADISELVAGKKALTKVGEDMAKALVDEITMIPAAATQNIQLVLSGLTYDRVRSLEGKLKEVRGIRRTHLQEFTGGVGRIDVEYNGKASQLADTLINAPAVKAFKLKVAKVSGNRVDVKGK